MDELNVECGADFFVVVKMMFHAFYFLIGFVPLACNEDDVAGTSHACGGPDGLATVHDSQRLTPLFL